MQNLPRGCQEFQSLLPKQTGSLGAKVGSEQDPTHCFFFLVALRVLPSPIWALHLFIGVSHLSLAWYVKLHCLFKLKPWTRMTTVHKQMLLNFGEFLCASANSGNAWETVNKCGSRGRDRAQDYVGCNDHSSADLFHGAKLWSLGPRYGMLGWTPVASGEKQQLCGWVWFTPLIYRLMVLIEVMLKVLQTAGCAGVHDVFLSLNHVRSLRIFCRLYLAKNVVKMTTLTIKDSIFWVYLVLLMKF